LWDGLLIESFNANLDSDSSAIYCCKLLQSMAAMGMTGAVS